MTSSSSASLGDDFPMLCGTCLGENPYVRMVKLSYGDKVCKISGKPYQAFRWKAGPHGRNKETIVSYAVAAERNICQTCLNDMKYNLPVGLRDKLIKDVSEHQSVIAVPQSEVGLQHYYNQQARLLATGDHSAQQNNSFAVDMNNLPASRQLQQFSQNLQNVANKSATKTAFRNLPKLCSFWLNGTCNRVLKKTCPFRPCCGPTSYAFPEIAGSDKEICAELVKQLEEVGPAKLMKTLRPDIKKSLSLALRGGNRDEAIRKRVAGEDDLTKQYLGKMKKMNMELVPPEDPSNVTLWLGNIDDDMTEVDIRDMTYAYGVILNIFISRPGKCAFIEFLDRPMAEHAARTLYNNLVIKGRKINVSWSKPKAINSSSSGSKSEHTDGAEGELVMMPPPGMEHAPGHAYSIPAPPPGHPPSDSTDKNSHGKRPASNQLAPNNNKVLYPSLKQDRLGSST